MENYIFAEKKIFWTHPATAKAVATLLFQICEKIYLCDHSVLSCNRVPRKSQFRLSPSFPNFLMNTTHYRDSYSVNCILWFTLVRFYDSLKLAYKIDLEMLYSPDIFPSIFKCFTPLRSYWDFLYMFIRSIPRIILLFFLPKKIVLQKCNY